MESKGQRWGWEDREGGETGKQEQTLPHSEERSEQKKKMWIGGITKNYQVKCYKWSLNTRDCEGLQKSILRMQIGIKLNRSLLPSCGTPTQLTLICSK